MYIHIYTYIYRCVYMYVYILYICRQRGVLIFLFSLVVARCKWNVVTYTNCPKSSNSGSLSCGGMKSSKSPSAVLLRNKTVVLIIMMISLMAIVWLSFEGTRASRISLSQKKKEDALLEEVLAAHRSKKFVCDRNRENQADFFQTRTCRRQWCARNVAHGKSIGPRMGLLSALAVACICVLGLLGSADARYVCSAKADCYYENCADRPCNGSYYRCNSGVWNHSCVSVPSIHLRAILVHMSQVSKS